MAEKTKKTTGKQQKTTEKKGLPKHLEGKGFKKGQSGNPKGRPKGRRNYASIFEDAVGLVANELNIKAKKEGKDVVYSPEDVEVLMSKRAIKEATNGNFNFYKDIHDRLHGKASQPIEHNAGEELAGAIAKLNVIIPD